MAWPETARNINFGAPPTQEMITSAFLNELQDRIVNLHKVGEEIGLAAIPQTDGTGLSGWSAAANPEDGWQCVVAARPLTLMVRHKGRMTCNNVKVKYYAAGVAGITFTLYRVQAYFDIAANAPVKTQLAQVISAITNAWGVATLTPASPEQIVSFDSHLIVVVTGAAVGELVAGGAANVLPQSPQS